MMSASPAWRADLRPLASLLAVMTTRSSFALPS